MPDLFLRIWIAVVDRVDRSESGQTTAEYALVLIAAAAIAGLVLAWATKTHAVSGLFDKIVNGSPTWSRDGPTGGGRGARRGAHPAAGQATVELALVLPCRPAPDGGVPGRVRRARSGARRARGAGRGARGRGRRRPRPRARRGRATCSTARGRRRPRGDDRRAGRRHGALPVAARRCRSSARCSPTASCTARAVMRRERVIRDVPSAAAQRCIDARRSSRVALVAVRRRSARLGGAAVAAARAQTAADAAALAAADQLALGRGAARRAATARLDRARERRAARRRARARGVGRRGRGRDPRSGAAPAPGPRSTSAGRGVP